MTTKRVLSVGQCCADHASLSHLLRQQFDAEIIPTATARETTQRLRQEAFALVLVNRILDADGSSGLELIKHLKADEATRGVPVMLVSNYEDAQQEAVRAGAEPGFGKAALREPQTVERLKAYLG